MTAEDLFESVKLYFPPVARIAVSYYESYDFELTINCSDGNTYVYDELQRTMTILPKRGELMTEDMWRREFGRRLKKRMERKHISQADLADIIGVTQGMVSNYICGRSMPSFYIVQKIAKALDCPLEDLSYL